MHWLKKWRRAQRLSREAFAAMVRTKDFSEHRPGTGCSARLIEILEGGGVTHPKIAARIAHVTGATLAEYESIIPEIHRNGKLPKAESGRKPKPKEPKEAKEPKPKGPRPYRAGGWGKKPRSVVKIDESGREIGRYASINAAVGANFVTKAVVSRRCERRMKRKNMFCEYGYTWRYAEEWDAMTAEERRKDIGGGEALEADTIRRTEEQEEQPADCAHGRRPAADHAQQAVQGL